MIAIALVAFLIAAYRSKYAANYLIFACFFAMAGLFIIVPIILVDRLIRMRDRATRKKHK